jgi:hypothetical protein
MALRRMFFPAIADGGMEVAKLVTGRMEVGEAVALRALHRAGPEPAGGGVVNEQNSSLSAVDVSSTSRVYRDSRDASPPRASVPPFSNPSPGKKRDAGKAGARSDYCVQVDLVFLSDENYLVGT